MAPAKAKAERPLQRFRVVGADHHHDDGKTYTRGKIVRDSRDLASAFPNKFQNLDNPDSLGDEGMEQITDKEVDVMDVPAHHAATVLQRGLKPAEDVTDEDEEGETPPASGIAAEGRERTPVYRGMTAARTSPASTAAEQERRLQAQAQTAAAEDDERGVDLTDDFEGASDKGLQIFKQGRQGYTVYKGDKAVKDGTFKKKAEVEEFLASK